MKANVLHGIGDLRFEDVPLPPCPPGWALVRVVAAGICSSDVGRVLTKGTYHFPTIPGHEFSGIVTAVGDEADAGWLGRRVGAFPLIPCGKCPQCQRRHYETCARYDYIGSRRDGALAEYVAVPVWNLVGLPDQVSFEAGAMLEPLCVALHAAKMAGNLSGARACVVGTGMVGIAAACWARRLGAAEAHVVGRGERKRPLAERFPGIAYHADWRDVADAGMDVVIEAAGSPKSLETALRLAAPEARVVLVGNPGGDMGLSQDGYWSILRKQLTLRGSWNSSYRGGEPSDWTEAVQALADGDMPVEWLITHRFAPGQALEAVRLMAGHREPYCKVMTDWGEG